MIEFFGNVADFISVICGAVAILVAIVTLIINIVKWRRAERRYKNELEKLYKNREEQSAEEVNMKIIKCDRCGAEITENAFEWNGFDLCAKCEADMKEISEDVKNKQKAREEAYAAFIEARDKYKAADDALAAATTKLEAQMNTGKASILSLPGSAYKMSK